MVIFVDVEDVNWEVSGKLKDPCLFFIETFASLKHAGFIVKKKGYKV